MSVMSVISAVLEAAAKLVPLFLMRKAGQNSQKAEQLEAEREAVDEASRARDRVRRDDEYRQRLRDKYGR